jgi:hypothetical protein
VTLLAIALLAVGCGKSGSTGGGGGPETVGIAVPREISALPAKAAGTSSSSLLATRRMSLATDSDYSSAQTVKSVDERALSQFDIFNTIFSAMEQTHYADAENVGKGPYGNMVTWIEEHGDGVQKQLVPWVVDSSMVAEGGKSVNQVLVWMLMPMGDGETHLIKVKMSIYEPPVRKPDGSYADFGVWRLDAGFDETGLNYFAAEARREGGLSVVSVHQKEEQREMKGILQKSDERGSGKVLFPDEDACRGPGGGDACQPPSATVAYVYDAAHVALQKNDQDVLYKDRNSVVDLANRYGLYDAVTGEAVAKSHSFGFPIRYTDAQGRQRYGYYGAWQGRHQIWSDNQQSLPAGTLVTRADRPSNQAAETYTVSNPFQGTLVKRTLVPADIQDLKDIVVETWVNKNYSLRYQDGSWETCVWPQPAPGQMGPIQPTCTAFTDWTSIAYNADDHRRFVGINYMPPPPQCQPGLPCPPQDPPQPLNLVYFADVDKFYVATQDNGQSTPTMPLQEWAPPAQFGNMWVNVGGSIYIQFNGTKWVQKKLVSFDDSTCTPTFDTSPGADVDYALEPGREYYVNNPGANYVVQRTESGYQVQIELQSVANPVNYQAFLPAGATFKPQWAGNGTTYAFVTDPASPSFLKLVYADVDPNDRTPGAAQGAVVQQGQWGLVAFVDGASTGVQYNWDYPRDGENWGTQQFLLNGDGSYKMLDDPLRFGPVALTNHAGVSKTYSLQFDGSWVNGLPDIYRELEKNHFVLSDEIADKVVLIPAGTEVVDAVTGKHYLFKPLQVSEYLYVIPNPGDLDLSTAAAIDLGQVPSHVASGMGAMPDVPVKYSEGKLVQ